MKVNPLTDTAIMWAVGAVLGVGAVGAAIYTVAAGGSTGATGAATGATGPASVGTLTASSGTYQIVFDGFSTYTSVNTTIVAGQLVTVVHGKPIQGIQIGDIIHVDFQAAVTVSGSTGFILYPGVTVPGSGIVQKTQWQGQGPMTNAPCSMFGSFTAPAAGTYTPNVMAFGTSANTINFQSVELRCNVVRP